MIYFTSDLHFGHNSILKYNQKYRSGYKTTSDMDEDLIKIWNQTVNPDDIVFSLGDFSFKGLSFTLDKLKRLNGKHHMILGNHDQVIIKYKDKLLQETKYDGNALIESIKDYRELKIFDEKRNKEVEFVLFHYPIMHWNKDQYGSIHLYGHMHDISVELDGRALNVCFDSHGKILSLDEVLDLVEHKKIANSHHQKNKD